MIRWITDNLGTAAFDEVATDEDVSVVDVRSLVDRAGNPHDLVRSKIDEAIGRLREGKRVAVCCDYGMSRSNAIAAGVLVISQGLRLEDAARRVTIATGQTAIRIEVLDAVRRAIGASDTKTVSPKDSRRILVTGGSGFIGSCVAGALQAKHTVVAPSRHDLDLARDTVALDTLVRDRGIDAILHLAWPRVYTTNESMGPALVMLKNVLDACALNRLRLIYLSSWEIYSGYQARELIADESLAPQPGGSYGQTKLLSEILIQTLQNRCDFVCTILRAGPVYGPAGDRPRFIWDFLRKALRDEPIVTHRYLNGFPHLDLLYVGDVCAAIVSAVDRGIAGAINLGTGVATSTAEIARRLIARVQSRSTVSHVDLQGYASNIAMNINRAAAVLDWRPRAGLNEGLEALVQIELDRQHGENRQGCLRP